jgi:hypothetical protein
MNVLDHKTRLTSLGSFVDTATLDVEVDMVTPPFTASEAVGRLYVPGGTAHPSAAPEASTPAAKFPALQLAPLAAKAVAVAAFPSTVPVSNPVVFTAGELPLAVRPSSTMLALHNDPMVDVSTPVVPPPDILANAQLVAPVSPGSTM